MPSTAPTMPMSRQLRLAWRSRDLWKERASRKQRSIRKLRVEIRDLRASRDRWKGKTSDLRSESAGPRPGDAGAPPSGET